MVDENMILVHRDKIRDIFRHECIHQIYCYCNVMCSLSMGIYPV